jgi:hypothetical protein
MSRLITCPENISPLMEAVLYRNPQAVQELLGSGIDFSIDCAPDARRTPSLPQPALPPPTRIFSSPDVKSEKYSCCKNRMDEGSIVSARLGLKSSRNAMKKVERSSLKSRSWSVIARCLLFRACDYARNSFSDSMARRIARNLLFSIPGD